VSRAPQRLQTHIGEATRILEPQQPGMSSGIRDIKSPGQDPDGDIVGGKRRAVRRAVDPVGTARVSRPHRNF
jgi:hypothetical protein